MQLGLRSPQDGLRPPVPPRSDSHRARALRLLAPLALAAAALLALGCGEARIEEIRALQEAGEVRRTVEPLRDILARNPDHAEARYRLGLALSRTGQPSLAVAHLRRAARSEEYAVDAGLHLASTLQQLGSHEESLERAEAVLEREPENPMALALRAHAALALKKNEVALESADRLIDLDPESYQGLSLRSLALANLKRFDEAEEALDAVSELAKEGPPALGARICIARARFQADAREDPERGFATAERCVERYAAEPSMLSLALEFYDDMERPEEAVELLRSRLAERPDDLDVRTRLADRLVRSGDAAGALEILRDGAETLDTPPAWVALAALHRDQGRPQQALEALDRASEGLDEPTDELRFERAAVMIELGKLEEAERAADAIQEPAYRDLVLGRVALDRGRPAEALELLQQSITAWPNNPAARMAAAHAARALGDLDEAAAQLREAVRADPGGNDAALQLARVQLERGELEEAVAFARRHLSSRGFTGPEAHIVAARAHAALGNHEQADRVLERLAEEEGYAGLALAERAYLDRQHRGVEPALERIEAAEIDLTAPANDAALRALVDLALQAGQPERARRAAERAAEAHPEHAPFHALMGRVAFETGDAEAARRAYERAHEVDPELPSALVGLGRIALAEGDAERAVARFDEATEAAPGDPEPAYRAAQAFLLAGRSEEAERRLGALLEEHPDHAGAANDLAWLLAEQGRDLDRALELAQRARLVLSGPEVLDTLGWVRLQRGEVDRAVEAFEQALAARPHFPTARYHLGVALARRGDTEAARRELRRALDAGPFPDASAAREQLARLGSGGRAEATP